MKPVDVARQLSIGGSTVRAWSKEFAEYLSPTAVGGDDRRRDFTVRDLQIMALIKGMSDRNVSRDEMNLELRRLADNDWRDLPMPEASQGDMIAMPSGDSMAVAFNVERRALLREIASWQEQARDLKAELVDERDDKEALLREIAELTGKLERALNTVELYDSGRLKPPGA